MMWPRLLFVVMAASVVALLMFHVPAGPSANAAALPQDDPGSAPFIAGLLGDHPLTQAQQGLVLINELQCVSCHEFDSHLPFEQKTAPDLTNIASRVSFEYLKQFIAEPSKTHQGTTMPDMMRDLDAEQRQKVANGIALFLEMSSLELGAEEFDEQPLADADAAAGKNLFHAVGCVACHTPRDETGKELVAKSISLAHVPQKYSPQSLAEFLFNPRHVRSSGRMPDMKLTREESRDIAQYLMTADGHLKRKPKELGDSLKIAALGQAFFAQYNCMACHDTGAEIPAAEPAMPLAHADVSRGCLSKNPKKTPDFNLSNEQRDAIIAALKAMPEKISDEDAVKLTFTTFNCIACHERDDYGGVAESRNEYFTTDEPDLGDDARIPPPLTYLGAKLKTLWLQKVLFEGESVRPYMHTRMPQYGLNNIGHLPELVDRVDKIDHHVDYKEPNREQRNAFRDAGRRLLGDKGLNCVTCHSFNGKESPNFDGIDLMTSHERLKPAWYDQFMKSPAKARPNIVMPEFWPGGEAAFKDILDGDTDKQIEAIYYYFSLGRSAPDPPGIRNEPTRLMVTDKPRVYRGRSGVAGYRGIAVGLPGGMNYAFNAETGTLSSIWTGDFVNVGWSGQGPGNFNPAGRSIQLSQDVSFYALPDQNAPWPLRPVMTKENPVNPDPLYPKNRGYQFIGYELDEDLIPTFMYKTGDVTIHDRSTASEIQEKRTLKRLLAFKTEKPRKVWFRALTGDVKRINEQQFETPRLRLTVSAIPHVLRTFGEEKKQQELLLHINLPAGQSKLELTYEPRR